MMMNIYREFIIIMVGRTPHRASWPRFSLQTLQTCSTLKYFPRAAAWLSRKNISSNAETCADKNSQRLAAGPSGRVHNAGIFGAPRESMDNSKYFGKPSPPGAEPQASPTLVGRG